ncbi:retrovirus-related pol polyprotein from transposon TNT 1-94 [Tanacetum coccineum]
MFGSLCYPTNERDDLGKMKPKSDIGIFIGYSESSREYYAMSPLEVSDNSAANTLDNEDTSSSSLIVVEEDKAPQIVSSSAKQVTNEPNTPVLNDNANELVQEDVAELDGNVFYNPPQTPVFEEAKSSSTYQDSEMKFFLGLQVHQSPQGIFICQSHYTMDLLKKPRMDKYDTVSTPMATTKLDADLQGTQVDQTKYHGMIGGLMYLTTSRPDIAFVTFVCACY